MALLLFGCAGVASAQGDSWPERPIRMLHGFIAGGAVDITARLVAAGLTDRLGQQVVVDGRPGAGGTVGAAIVARAEPDGHTLFLMASGHAASAGLYRKLPYDAVKDFAMITLVASNPFVLAASMNFPAQSVGDLVRMAKAEPDKINYGTGGVGTGMHLASLLFQNRAGIRMTHVPYKGGNAAPMALLGGEIPLIFNTPSGVEAHVRAKRMRVLAITTRSRFALWPDAPTIAETAVPGFDVRGWYAVAAPKNVPASRVKRVNEAVRESLKRPDIGGKLTGLGAEVAPTTPEAAQRFLASEVARWTKLIRDEKIPPQN
ncbi:MAG TPA: tripartite tricarboxylate transporter substrate binding protein [Burkholderiales bacterium]|nr:tripartite tricarboxylate transporter substrate binding protein [Burkholderiales bacterium]